MHTQKNLINTQKHACNSDVDWKQSVWPGFSPQFYKGLGAACGRGSFWDFFFLPARYELMSSMTVKHIIRTLTISCRSNWADQTCLLLINYERLWIQNTLHSLSTLTLLKICHCLVLTSTFYWTFLFTKLCHFTLHKNWLKAQVIHIK